jgi:hypothetical protein
LSALRGGQSVRLTAISPASPRPSDVDVGLLVKKFRKGPVRKLEHVSAAPFEQVIQKSTSIARILAMGGYL